MKRNTPIRKKIKQYGLDKKRNYAKIKPYEIVCKLRKTLCLFFFFLIVQLPICLWTADNKSPEALKRSVPETSTLTLVSHSTAIPSSALHMPLKMLLSKPCSSAWKAAGPFRSSQVSTDRALFRSVSTQGKHPLILALSSPRGLTQPSTLACRN